MIPGYEGKIEVLDEIARRTEDTFWDFGSWQHMLPPGIEKVGEENPSYNCLLWVVGFIPARKKLEEGGLNSVETDLLNGEQVQREYVQPGDVVCYYSDEDERSHHKAFVVRYDKNADLLIVESKWGIGPVFEHPDVLVPSGWGYPERYISKDSIPRPREGDPIIQESPRWER